MVEEVQELLGSQAIQQTIEKLAEQIVAAHQENDQLILIGIRHKGEKLAERLANVCTRLSDKKIEIGVVDTSLYRDDLGGLKLADHPVLCPTALPCSVEGRQVILIDDVLYTGRTVKAALDALVDLGRPAKIELAVLIDRGGREFPIQPDYVGRETTIADDQSIKLVLKEKQTEDIAFITSCKKVINH